MDGSSTGLHDRLGSLSKSDGTSKKEKEDLPVCKTVDTYDPYSEQLVQRCVIIQRDEKGYGLTVSGDNPVFVQSVKEDGAAARAGVRQGDRIIKVNGTLVTQSNHQEVVNLIKSGSYVALTLLGKPPNQGNRSPCSAQTHNYTSSIPGSHSKLPSPSERITGPQPVDPEKQQQLNNAKVNTIRKMLEQDVIYLEKLRSEFAKTPSEKIRAEINSAIKRVKTLEDQLFSLTGTHHDLGIQWLPRSPTTARHVQQEKENIRAVSFSGQHSSNLQGRPLIHQFSEPLLPKSERLNFSSDVTESSPPLLIPTTQLHQARTREGKALHQSHKQLSISNSLENIAKPSSPKPTSWPHALSGPTHSRQSSSPEALLYHVENLRELRTEGCKVTSPDSLTRSHSELGPHPNIRKAGASEAFPETEGNKRRRGTSSSSRFDSATDSSPHGSPPGTPPPAVDSGTDSMECEVEVEEVQEEDVSSMNCVSPSALTDPSSASSPETRPEPCNTSESKPLPAVTLELHPAQPLTSSNQQYGTPPETQAPPAGVVNLGARILAQHPYIIPMEDEDWPSDSEVGHLEDHGPFNNIRKLLRFQAHLAVFLHFLISNSDPSSLLFCIITKMYEDGTGKEMKKWAYEIHSTFLVPGAPLKVNNVEEAVLLEIDDVLQNQLEKEDILRSVFVKARKKAEEELSEQLAEFRNKRTMGLGNIFGPPDYQLDEATQDKNKEVRIIEQLLVPILETLFTDDLDNASDRGSALASALATALKQFGIKGPQALTLVDRCPTFVAKDKTRLRFLQRNKKMIPVLGHHFIPQHYYSVAYCNHCQLIIWGVGNQGYQCQNCEMNIHKSCVKVVEENCIGSVRNKKDKKKDRMSGIMENIIGKSRKPSQPTPSAIERAKKLNEDWTLDPGLASLYSHGGDGYDSGDRAQTVTHGDRIDNHLHILNNQDISDLSNHAKKGTSIGRSESFRQRRESRPSFRKRSDPNIPRSKSDVDVDDKPGTDLNNSGSSSNSSLSARSLDSPSNSLEMVHRTPSGTPADAIPGAVPAISTPPSHLSTSSTIHQYDDSDLEAEADPPNWQENVDWEMIRMMKPKEKKRQDVINELFHTERTHVRNLKVLDRLFFRPLLQEHLLVEDFLHLLFPNLEEMLEIHGSFNSKMKARRREEAVIGDVGEMMLEMLDGASGEDMKRAAAVYCRNQSVALENLKNRQKKDQKLAQFLADAEAHHLCRRLQLKDFIATGFQRLTKYPLLLENIAKYTAPNSVEHANLLRAVDCSKQILAHVNQAVKEAENQHRLSELQRKLDKSAFEKVEHKIAQSFRDLDLTKHRLLYEGPLTWRLNKQKSIEMHVVLLEDIMVLLQKQDDKYILKFHNTNITTGRDETKLAHSPILRIQYLLTRNVATDKRGFFLVSTSEQHAMYEFVAVSPSERKIWLKHITEAADACKNKDGKSKPQEPLTSMAERTESVDENHEESDTRSKEVSVLQDRHSESVDSGEVSDVGEPLDLFSVENKSPPVVDSSSSSPSPAPQPSEPGCQASTQKDVSQSGETKTQRRLQRVEILKIADGPQLIEPCEVVVSQGAILQTAEPVLTPIEQLRRKDLQISAALAEKQDLVADILQVPKDEFEHIAEIAGEMEGEKDVRDLVLAAIYQANRLASLLNETLRVTEEDTISASNVEMMPEATIEVPPTSVPSPRINRKLCHVPSPSPDKLLNISNSLNRQLSQLLGIVTQREEERSQLRKELHSSREQIHLLHEVHRNCTLRSQSPSSHSRSHSRPSSFISIASSTSEGVCDTTDSVHFLPNNETVLPRSVEERLEETSAKEGFEESLETGAHGCESQTNDDSSSDMYVDASSDMPSPFLTNCPVTDLDHDDQTSDSSCSSQVTATEVTEVTAHPANVHQESSGESIESQPVDATIKSDILEDPVAKEEYGKVVDSQESSPHALQEEHLSTEHSQESDPDRHNRLDCLKETDDHLTLSIVGPPSTLPAIVTSSDDIKSEGAVYF